MSAGSLWTSHDSFCSRSSAAVGPLWEVGAEVMCEHDGEKIPTSSSDCQLFQLHVVYLSLRWHPERNAAISSVHVPNPRCRPSPQHYVLSSFLELVRWWFILAVLEVTLVTKGPYVLLGAITWCWAVTMAPRACLTEVTHPPHVMNTRLMATVLLLELRMKPLVSEPRKRMWWRVISETGLFAHCNPFLQNFAGTVSQWALPLCRAVREAPPPGRATRAWRSRKPSLQKGCIDEAFMWLSSLGLQRPARFGVASLNFITRRFYSVVVRVRV